MSLPALVRYRYPGTTNGRPVGEVYLYALPEKLAGRSGVYSYSKDPAEASHFTATEAAALVRRAEETGSWPGAVAVPADGAPVLPDAPRTVTAVYVGEGSAVHAVEGSYARPDLVGRGEEVDTLCGARKRSRSADRSGRVPRLPAVRLAPPTVTCRACLRHLP